MPNGYGQAGWQGIPQWLRAIFKGTMFAGANQYDPHGTRQVTVENGYSTTQPASFIEMKNAAIRKRQMTRLLLIGGVIIGGIVFLPKLFKGK